MHKTILSAICLIGTSAGASFAQDSVDPVAAFNTNCRQCHSVKEGDNRLGPTLHGVVGREAGTAEGYRYSTSLQNADFAWDEEQLDRWIQDPDSVVSGHKMKPYPGIDEPGVRAAIIAHLAATDGDAEGGEEGDSES